MSEFQINAESRHQVFVEGYKVSQSLERVPGLMDSVLKSYNDIFRSSSLDVTTTEFNKLIRRYQVELKEIYSEFNDSLLNEQSDFKVSEAEFEAELLNRATNDLAPAVESASNNQIDKTLASTPVSASGLVLTAHMAAFGASSISRVIRTIRNMYHQDKSFNEIYSEVFGFSKGKYNGAVASRLQRDAITETHTAIQQISTVSKMETMRRSGVTDGYTWVSTLDGKTSDTCKGLDGESFEFGKGPTPPIHRRCRSTTIANINRKYQRSDIDYKRASKGSTGRRQVDADETYYTWLKKQSRAFQDAALGKTKAKLLRDGGLTEERFAALSLNRNFKPRTLEEMKKLAPTAFENAEISL